MSASAAMAKAEETVMDPKFEGFSGKTYFTIRSSVVLFIGIELPAVSVAWRFGFSITKVCHPRKRAGATRGCPLAKRDGGSNTDLTSRGRKRGLDRGPQGPSREVTAADRAPSPGQIAPPLRFRFLALNRFAASPLDVHALYRLPHPAGQLL